MPRDIQIPPTINKMRVNAAEVRAALIARCCKMPSNLMFRKNAPCIASMTTESKPQSRAKGLSKAKKVPV